MRPFQQPADRRTIWMPLMPQDADGTPPAADPAGTMITPNFDSQTYVAAAGVRVVPSLTLGL